MSPLQNRRSLMSGRHHMEPALGSVRVLAIRSAYGQVLVLVALGLVALLAMAAIVIDGGNAWVQQRGTQNGTDSASEAGAVVLVQMLAATNPSWTSSQWDAAVADAVTTAASNTQNNLTSIKGYYTDVSGNLLTTSGTTATDLTNAAVVGAGTVPTGAQGVRALGTRTFNAYLAGIIGITNLTTPADATTVAGALGGICAASDGCAVVPVTVPVIVDTCAGNGVMVPGTGPWPLVAPADASGANEAIVPLCKNGPGAVGWLDLGAGNLSQQITTPTNQAFDVPTWLQTNPGNPNNVDTEMNTYDGEIILIPMFDGTCKDKPTGGALTDCTAGAGVGNDTWYHIPKFTAFLLDHAYIQGNNHPECNSAPGAPFVGGHGSTSCLKGWFTKYITQGPVVAGGGGSTDPSVMGVQLIK